MNSEFNLKILGSRGSMPVEGENFSIYGGSTSCYQVLAGDEEIYLDAGSGIFNASPLKNSHITILLTHMHIDHIIGLPFFLALTEKDRTIDIYSQERSGLLPQDAIDRLISPPFWPIKISSYPADVNFKILPKKFLVSGDQYHFSIGNVSVDAIEGNHPGGSTIYKLSYNGKSIVYATDFEHNSIESCKTLINFAKNCDLLLYDAQYIDEEYHKYQGYGHSTPEAGIKIAEESGAKKIIFIHHSPGRTDKELSELENKIFECNKNISFAKIGDEIVL